jgi:hypothetical protein
MLTVRQLTCYTAFFLIGDCIQVSCKVSLLSGFKLNWLGLKVSSRFRIHFCDSCSKFYAPVSTQRFLVGTWIKSSQVSRCSSLALHLSAVCRLFWRRVVITFFLQRCYMFLPTVFHSLGPSPYRRYETAYNCVLRVYENEVEREINGPRRDQRTTWLDDVTNWNFRVVFGWWRVRRTAYVAHL